MIPVKESSPVLISNGMEEVSRFHLTSNFVINAEEDLGIEGLRIMKEQMKPVDMIKMYNGRITVNE
jgi:hypothetical protein